MATLPSRAPEGADDLRARFAEVAPVILVDPAPVLRRGRRRRAIVRAAAGVGVIVAVLAVVLVTRPGSVPPVPPAGTTPPPEPTRPVAIQVEPRVARPGDVLTATLVASADNDLTFGVAAEVDRWDGSEWQRAGVVGLCLESWNCTGTVTDRLDGVEDVGLSAAPGTPGEHTLLSTAGLADGWYRLVQRAALDDGLASGQFEVRTAASAAAPRPAHDAVWLAIQPERVPPEGGLVDVVTQVAPGPDGTLTEEEIEAADRALGTSAGVERWDGTRWIVEASVTGEDREAGAGVESGSTVLLPALVEGSYRLVREAADGSAPWGVFTVTPDAPALAQPEPDDVAPPAHDPCALDPGRCLLGAWWADVTAAAGVETGGGDHDIGLHLTDTVIASGGGTLWVVLVPAQAQVDGTRQLTVEATSERGESTLESGHWDDGADGRRLTCGGFMLETSSTDVEPSEVDHLVGLLADALRDCPADVAALAARYPDVPPLP